MRITSVTILLLWAVTTVTAQEKFRFISTSQFLCGDNTVKDSSNIEEYHNNVEIIAVGSTVIIPTQSEWTQAPAIIEGFEWQNQNDSTIVGFSAKSQVYVEWQRRHGEQAVQIRWHGGWFEAWEYYRNMFYGK